MRSLTICLSAIFTPSILIAEPKVLKDIAYAGTKHERQTLDVYLPANPGKLRPVMFWIHGGGWESGTKAEVDLKPQAFTGKGFVFVSIGYRLIKDQVTIDQMAGDIAKAIRWVHDHADDYGIDPKRSLVGGHSAGAQLAALVCTDGHYLADEKIDLSSIRGCIPVDGDTYDVPLQIATVNERIANIYRKKFGDEASQKKLSPVTHVAKGKNIPPVLILYVADHKEAKIQSERLVRVLQDAGLTASAYSAENKTHTTINSELGKPDDKPSTAMFAFVEKSLAK